MNAKPTRPSASPINLDAPQAKLPVAELYAVAGRGPLVPLGVSTLEDQTASVATFGAMMGRATAQSLDDTILADPIIANCNRVASTVSVSDEIEQRILMYAIRTIELSKGQFDFRVNFRFEDPRRDLVSAGEGVLQIQGYRDRLCQLEIELRQAKKKLDSAYDSGMEYLFETYPNKMNGFNRDVERRKIFTGKLFRPLNDKLSQVRALLEQIKAALENLDKAHFAYKEVVEVGKTILNRVEGRAGA